MRRARFLVPESMSGLYHVVSRVVDRRMVFGEAEKRHFLKLMKMYAAFSGLTVVSWCLMDNHFHMLVAVPPKDSEEVPEKEVLRRMGLLYGRKEMKEFAKQLGDCGAEESRRKLLAPFRKRMGDLGQFMKTLKQRFTQWFNRQHARKGTLWEDRYRSTIVEHEGWEKDGSWETVGAEEKKRAVTGPAELKSHAARVVAAYIDLNPIRAGVVEDPKDYPWSSYGAAVRGNKEGVRGIRMLWGGGQEMGQALAKHRVFLFEEGSEERVPEVGEQSQRSGIDARKVWEERTRGGRLPLPVMLRLRVRYLTDGAVVGSKEFLENVTGGGTKGGTKTGKSGTAMRFGEWGGLHALRNLRTNLVG